MQASGGETLSTVCEQKRKKRGYYRCKQPAGCGCIQWREHTERYRFCGGGKNGEGDHFWVISLLLINCKKCLLQKKMIFRCFPQHNRSRGSLRHFFPLIVNAFSLIVNAFPLIVMTMMIVMNELCDFFRRPSCVRLAATELVVLVRARFIYRMKTKSSDPIDIIFLNLVGWKGGRGVEVARISGSDWPPQKHHDTRITPLCTRMLKNRRPPHRHITILYFT